MVAMFRSVSLLLRGAVLQGWGSATSGCTFRNIGQRYASVGLTSVRHNVCELLRIGMIQPVSREAIFACHLSHKRCPHVFPALVVPPQVKHWAAPHRRRPIARPAHRPKCTVLHDWDCCFPSIKESIGNFHHVRPSYVIAGGGWNVNPKWRTLFLSFCVQPRRTPSFCVHPADNTRWGLRDTWLVAATQNKNRGSILY